MFRDPLQIKLNFGYEWRRVEIQSSLPELNERKESHVKVYDHLISHLQEDNADPECEKLAEFHHAIHKLCN